MSLTVLTYPKDKEKVLRRLKPVFSTDDPKTIEDVMKIIARVRKDGDKALIQLSRKHDKHPVTMPKALRLNARYLEQAWKSLPEDLQGALRRAKMRIQRFHEQQKPKGFKLSEPSGTVLIQQVLPLGSVGVYVPGGAAAYPSSVLMNVIPAKVAGVRDIVMVTPPSAPSLGRQAVLGAAHLCKIDRVYQAGGAQAIAALAHGTETVPQVEKVVGPGNRWVATAKKLLYGQIDIDSVAGPSEVLILADETAKPELIAVDMLAQAEHDPDASAIAIVIGSKFDVSALQRAVKEQTRDAHRAKIIEQSLKSNGLIIKVGTLDQAVELANLRAPEHCEVMTANPLEAAKRLHNAAALFVGEWTPVAMGDYAAGPNHVLPTSGTARFFSPLGVHDFVKCNHIVHCSQKGFEALAPTVRTLAAAEGFEAHRASVDIRLRPPEPAKPKAKAKPKSKAKPKPAKAKSAARRKS